MSERTLPELSRAVDSLERRFSDYVRKDVYDGDVRGIREDVAEIKDSQKWMQRLLVGNFVTLVVALILFLLERSTG